MSNIITTSDYAGKVFLACVLPGLGKSFLHRKFSFVVNYEDWCINEGTATYTSRMSRDVAVDLHSIICANAITLQNSCLFILSSIPWENFELPDLNTGIYIHMIKGEYNAEELSLRSRHDLVIDHFDDIEGWNKELVKLIGSCPNQLNKHYLLDSGEFITIDRLLAFCDESNSISISDIQKDYSAFFVRDRTEVCS